MQKKQTAVILDKGSDPGTVGTFVLWRIFYIFSSLNHKRLGSDSSVLVEFHCCFLAFALSIL